MIDESKRRSFIKPIALPYNPRSRTIIQDFLDSELLEAEVDTSWASSPRLVYDRLHKYLSYNKHIGVTVMITGDTVALQKNKAGE